MINLYNINPLLLTPLDLIVGSKEVVIRFNQIIPIDFCMLYHLLLYLFTVYPLILSLNNFYMK